MVDSTKNLRLDIPFGKIRSVRFTMFSDEEKEHFFTITPQTTDGNRNKELLNDSRMGVISRSEGNCPKCNADVGVNGGHTMCPGHLGAMRLPTTYYHPMLLERIAVILMIFCPTCYRIKLFKTAPDSASVVATINAIRDSNPFLQFIDALAELCRQVKCCGKSATTFKVKRSADKLQPGRIMRVEGKETTNYPAVSARDFISRFNRDDLQLIGMDGDAHPSRLILSRLQITPRAVRPTIQDEATISFDQLTEMYSEILGKAYTASVSADSPDKRQQYENEIILMYRNLISNKEPAIAGSSPQKGICERLKGKYGRLRNNLMGKRVNFCSRSVISGDPTISIVELGVPRSTAMRVTFPEVVTHRNHDFLQKLVKNGNSYPGAVKITLINGMERILDNIGGGGTERQGDGGDGGSDLEFGTIVHRHLLDGDFVLFNRQPSLHKMSFMGHRVKVLPYSTYRLNLAVCGSYNADFDGDEMQSHCPQDLECVAEMAEIMMTSKQIVSVKNGCALINIVQDALLGCYILCGRGVFVSRETFCEYMMWVGYCRKEGSYRKGYQLAKYGVTSDMALEAALGGPGGLGGLGGPGGEDDHAVGASMSGERGGGFSSSAGYRDLSSNADNSISGASFLSGTQPGGYGKAPSFGGSGGDSASAAQFGAYGPSGAISGVLQSSAEADPNGAYYHKMGTNVNTNDLIALDIPQPAVCFPRPCWTGKQVFSLCLPERINLVTGSPDDLRDPAKVYVDAYVNILNGALMTGICAKAVVGGSAQNLIHVLFKDFGSEACHCFLDNCQRVVNRFLLDHSFSIGLKDMVISNRAVRSIHRVQDVDLLDKARAAFTRSIRGAIKLAPGQTRQEGYEGETVGLFQSVSKELETIVTADLPHSKNALLVMCNAGSKGKLFNIMQIAASLGQQYLQSARLRYRFYVTSRTTPHYNSFQNFNLESRGYVFSSFIHGLNVCEFLGHAVGGREGVCDTAVKTADSGYVERKLMKNMESIMSRYDGTVRNDVNQIIQFRYGDDGLDAGMCEAGSYRGGSCSECDVLRSWYILGDVFATSFGVDEQVRARVLGAQRSVVEELLQLPRIVERATLGDRGRAGAGGLSTYEFREPLFFTEIMMGAGAVDGNPSAEHEDRFHVVVDENVASDADLRAYLRFHMQGFLESRAAADVVQRSCLPIDYWLVRSEIERLLFVATPGAEDASHNIYEVSASDHPDACIKALVLEYVVLLMERCWFQRVKLQLGDVTARKTLAMNVHRLIRDEHLANMLHKPALEVVQTGWPTTLSPVDAIRMLNELLGSIRLYRNKDNAAPANANASKLLRVVLREELCSKNVCQRYRFSQTQFARLLSTIYVKFLEAQSIPGDAMGALCGHSISEPATQLTLNTFHTAGTSSLGSLGLPRLKELIDYRDTKIPITNIYLSFGAAAAGSSSDGSGGGGGSPYYARSADDADARSRAQARAWMRLAALIEKTRFEDYVTAFSIVFDPSDAATQVVEDQGWIGDLASVDALPAPADPAGDALVLPFVVRFEISLKMLEQKGAAGFDVPMLVERILHAFSAAAGDGDGGDAADAGAGAHSSVKDEPSPYDADLIGRAEDDTTDDDAENAAAGQADGAEKERKYPPQVLYYAGIGTSVVRVRPVVSRRVHGDGASASVAEDLARHILRCNVSGNARIKKVFMATSSPTSHYGFDKYTFDLQGGAGTDTAGSVGGIGGAGGACGDSAAVDALPADVLGRLGSLQSKIPLAGKRSEMEVEELFLQTEGSDLMYILTRPGVDYTRTYSNNIADIYNVLGIEAARSLFIDQIRQTLSSVELNLHHYLLLADIMMSRPVNGRMVSINRHGMRLTETGILAQASFEQPGNLLLNAAAYGLTDPVTSVSSAVIVGAISNIGTGCFDVLLDTTKLPAMPITKNLFPTSAYRNLEPKYNANFKKDGADRDEQCRQSGLLGSKENVLLTPSENFVTPMSLRTPGSYKVSNAASFHPNFSNKDRNQSRIGSKVNTRMSSIRGSGVVRNSFKSAASGTFSNRGATPFSCISMNFSNSQKSVSARNSVGGGYKSFVEVNNGSMMNSLSQALQQGSRVISQRSQAAEQTAAVNVDAEVANNDVIDDNDEW